VCAQCSANVGAITAALMRLLDRTSAADLQLAILEALEHDVPHPNAGRLALERRRRSPSCCPPCVGARRAGAATPARNL
jgi:hypothetical protein